MRVPCTPPHGEDNLAIESRPLLTPEAEIPTSESSTDDIDRNAKTLISEYRTKNNNKVVIATLNINSLRN